MRSTILLMLFIVAGLFCAIPSASAQEDPLETAKTYPPRLLGLEINETNLTSIDWRLELKQDLLERLRRKMDVAADALAVYSEKIDQLNSELPIEVRFVDKSVRARLVGKTMEELLDARLDLATRESLMNQLQRMLAEKRDTKRARLIQQQSQMAIQAAKLKLNVAESQYAQSQKLADKGYTTENETMVSRYNLDIAKQELESVVLKAEVESEQQNAELAQRLTDARVEIEPVKSRIAAAEEFLKTFVESSKISNEIEEMQRAFERAKDGRLDLISELSRLDNEIEELRVLKSRIERGMKAMESKNKESKTLDEKKSDK